MVNRIIRYGTWIAAALCFLLISATVDRVPDNPAEFKQLTRGISLCLDHQAPPAADRVRVIGGSLMAERSVRSWLFRGEGKDTTQYSNQPRLMRLAADSSPPFLPSVTV